jgi:release factor glutamine methyltransferase
MVTVDELLMQAHSELQAAPFRPARREAKLLLSSILGWNEAGVMSRGDVVVPSAAAERFSQLLRRRLTGEPVAYLLGEREFFGRPFFVDSRVLIPRPETEHLVEMTLENIPSDRPLILDLGTGSGCLAVTLACEIPHARVVAVDNSIGAAAVARRNVIRHDVRERVTVLSADFATALDLRAFDFVLTNPPYVDPEDERLVSKEVVEFEPAPAVFAPGRGYAIINRLLKDLAPLAKDTPLCFEIGAGQKATVSRLLLSSPFELLEIRPDLAGIPRIVFARRK